MVNNLTKEVLLSPQERFDKHLKLPDRVSPNDVEQDLVLLCEEMLHPKPNTGKTVNTFMRYLAHKLPVERQIYFYLKASEFYPFVKEDDTLSYIPVWMAVKALSLSNDMNLEAQAKLDQFELTLLNHLSFNDAVNEHIENKVEGILHRLFQADVEAFKAKFTEYKIQYETLLILNKLDLAKKLYKVLTDFLGGMYLYNKEIDFQDKTNLSESLTFVSPQPFSGAWRNFRKMYQKIKAHSPATFCPKMKEIVTDILSDSQKILKPPGSFVLLDKGTLLRGEATDCSDFDCAFLIEKESIRSEFIKTFLPLYLAQVKFYLNCLDDLWIVNTMKDQFSIERVGGDIDQDLEHLIGTSEISLAKNVKINESEVFLVNTPEKTFEWMTEGLYVPNFDEGLLAYARSLFFAQPIFASFKNPLFDKFQNLLNAWWQTPNSNRKKIYDRFFNRHLRQFENRRVTDVYISHPQYDKIMNLKTAFIHPLMKWCFDLAFYLKISTPYTVEGVLEALKSKQFPHYFLSKFEHAWHAAVNLRWDKQRERKNLPEASEPNRFFITETVQENVDILFRYHLPILTPQEIVELNEIDKTVLEPAYALLKMLYQKQVLLDPLLALCQVKITNLDSEKNASKSVGVLINKLRQRRIPVQDIAGLNSYHPQKDERCDIDLPDGLQGWAIEAYMALNRVEKSVWLTKFLGIDPLFEWVLPSQLAKLVNHLIHLKTDDGWCLAKDIGSVLFCEKTLEALKMICDPVTELPAHKRVLSNPLSFIPAVAAIKPLHLLCEEFSFYGHGAVCEIPPLFNAESKNILEKALKMIVEMRSGGVEDRNLLKIYWLVILPLFRKIEKMIPHKFCDVSLFDVHIDHVTKLRHLDDESERNRYIEKILRYIPDETELIEKIADVPNRRGARYSFILQDQFLQSRLESFIFPGSQRFNAIEWVRVTFPSSQQGYLPSHLIENIIDKNDGKIRRSYEDCIHRVSPSEKYEVHFKRPTQPMMEDAMHNLHSKMGGDLTPAIQLVRFDVKVANSKGSIFYPVLISQTVGKTTLRGEIPKKLGKEQWARWTRMLLCAVVICPGDGKRSNYVLNAINKIFCVDNEFCLLDLGNTQKNIQDLNFPSELFRLYIDTELDRLTIQEFCNLEIDSILESWIDEVIEKEAQYAKLFSENELKELYENSEETGLKKVKSLLVGSEPDGFRTKLLLKRGVISAMRLQFFRLRTFCLQNESIKPLDLLKTIIHLKENGTEVPIGLEIYEMCRRQLTITTKKSLSQSQSDQFCFGEIIYFFKDMQNREDLSLKLAREELTLRVFSLDNSISGVVSKNLKSIRADFKDMICQGRPEISRQQKGLVTLAHIANMTSEDGQGRQRIYDGTRYRKPRTITLTNCIALNAQYLEPFLHRGLEELDISFCAEIDEQCLSLIKKQCQNLKHLYLGGHKNLKTFTLSLEDLPRLEFLSIAACEAMEKIDVESLLLEEVNIKKCSSLASLQLRTPLLVKLSVIENPVLKTLNIHANVFPRIYSEKCTLLRDSMDNSFGHPLKPRVVKLLTSHIFSRRLKPEEVDDIKSALQPVRRFHDMLANAVYLSENQGSKALLARNSITLLGLTGPLTRDFRGSRIAHAHLERVNLLTCNLRGADLTAVNLYGALVSPNLIDDRQLDTALFIPTASRDKLVTVQSDEAHRWRQIAACRGDLDALEGLDYTFEHFDILPDDPRCYMLLANYFAKSNPRRRILWLLLADEQKIQEAKESLIQITDSNEQYLAGDMYSDRRYLSTNTLQANLWYMRAASQNHPQAALKLGTNFRFANRDNAFFWLKKAYELKVMPALNVLDSEPMVNHPGVSLYLGQKYYELEKYEESIKHFQEAAKAGSVEVYDIIKDYPIPAFIFARGLLCQEGLGGAPKNDELAFHLFSLANDRQYTPALYRIGLCLLYGQGTQKNFSKALNYLVSAALARDSKALQMLHQLVTSHGPEAQNSIGVYYYKLGLNTEDDKEKSKAFAECVRYLKMAANHFTAACYNLGLCFEFGRGVDINEQLAIHNYSKALNPNYANVSQVIEALNRLSHHPEALMLLGDYYSEDDIVAKTFYLEAIKFFHPPAVEKLKRFEWDIDVRYHLGCYYLNQKSFGLAKKYFFLSCEEPLKGKAYLKLGLCFQQGDSNDKVACDYYVKAYFSGEKEEAIKCLRNLGKECVLIGDHYCNKKDYKEAKIWYLKAFNENSAEAAFKLGVICEDNLNQREEAIEYYRKAVKDGYRGALQRFEQVASEPTDYHLIGMCYFEGCGVSQDFDKSLNFLLKIIHLDEYRDQTEIQYRLGLIYKAKSGFWNFSYDAFLWFKKAAGKHKGALSEIKSMAFWGYYPPRIYLGDIEKRAGNYKAAFMHYKSADAMSEIEELAHLNFFNAQLYLGDYYCDKNLREALDYYTLADIQGRPKGNLQAKKALDKIEIVKIEEEADKDCFAAQYFLGLYYIDKDFVKGLRYIAMAIAHQSSQDLRVQMLRQVFHEKVDIDAEKTATGYRLRGEAYELYRKYEDASFCYRKSMRNALRLNTDVQDCVRGLFISLERLAKKNVPAAQLFVGNCYFLGEGVERNFDLAKRFWGLAQNKNSCAKYNLDNLNKQGKFELKD